MSDYIAKGAPEVPLSLLQKFCRDLGFDPAQVKSIQVTTPVVTVTSYHLREGDGARFLVPGTHGVATVTTEVKVTTDWEETT